MIGAALALVLYSATVIAMPLLLDREVDIVSAMIASFKTVLGNPPVMIGWGLIVAGLVIVAMLPAFLGLIIVLPVLGHATWHLYARGVRSGNMTFGTGPYGVTESRNCHGCAGQLIDFAVQQN